MEGGGLIDVRATWPLNVGIVRSNVVPLVRSCVFPPTPTSDSSSSVSINNSTDRVSVTGA